jgi:hypothetical protein
MPGCGILTIRDYREKLLKEEPMKEITPPQVAEALKSYARTTLQLAGEIPAGTNKELRLTLGDLTAMAHLGNYYAEKVLGATDLALFEKTGKPEQQGSAIKHLEAALEHWQKYAHVTSSQYRPQLLTRIGYVDLNALTAEVRKDMEIARRSK